MRVACQLTSWKRDSRGTAQPHVLLATILARLVLEYPRSPLAVIMRTTERTRRSGCRSRDHRIKAGTSGGMSTLKALFHRIFCTPVHGVTPSWGVEVLLTACLSIR